MKTEGLHVVRPRAAGLDVHKMEITATVRICEGEGEPAVETRCFSTLPSGLDEMVAWLSEHGVEAAVMEGTGIYWQAPFAALEAAGIEAILGACATGEAVEGAQDRRGRQRVAGLRVPVRALHAFPCSASAVPQAASPEPPAAHHGQAALRRAQPRAEDHRPRRRAHRRHPLRRLRRQRPQDPLDGLAQGAAREAILASLTSHVANKLEGLGEALTLSLGDNDRFMLNDLLEEHDALEARIASYTAKIDEQMAPWEEQLRLLTTIPGIDRIAASTILIEIGPDIEVFASKEHFAARAGLCPGNNESGGKRRNDPLPKRLQDPARHPRRVRTRGRPNQGLPVRGPPPRACRPAQLQARRLRRRTQDAAHRLCGAEVRKAPLRPHRRLRGPDGQAQRPALDPHAPPLRLRIEPVDAELKAA